MKFDDFTLNAIKQRWCWTCLFVLLTPFFSTANDGFTEPHVILYGKVWQRSQGSSHTIHEGTVNLSLVNRANASNQLDLAVELAKVGVSGEYSYEVRLPQSYLLGEGELDEALNVSAVESIYDIQSLTLNGIAGTALEPAQAILTTNFSDKAQLHVFDMVFTYNDVDTDGDTVPDWWEELYGFNANYNGDVNTDRDGDGWLEWQEFERGTSPDEDNRVLSVATKSIEVPLSGTSGFYLNIIDSDSLPSEIFIDWDAGVGGIDVVDSDLNQVFDVTYEDMLAGEVLLRADVSSTGGKFYFYIYDDISDSLIEESVEITIFNPMSIPALQPKVWLDGGNVDPLIANTDPVGEWLNLAEDSGDAYAPFINAQPVWTESIEGLEAVEFSGSEFMYLDFADFDLSAFTMMLMFSRDAQAAADESLVSTSDFQLNLLGTDDAAYPGALVAQFGNQQVIGPVIPASETYGITWTAEAGSSTLFSYGFPMAHASETDQEIGQAYATLGAKQLFSDANASQFFNGIIGEVILFDSTLSLVNRQAFDDYLHSRWDNFTLWDLSVETISLTVGGNPNTPNIINLGLGDDTLIGGDFEDVLRGGLGNDIYTGNLGNDRFVVAINGGNDAVTDFIVGDDILDFTLILADETGSPDEYIKITSKIERVDGSAPAVHALIEVDADRDGNIDQSVTVYNQTWQDDDLLWLVTEGHLNLGGPVYKTSLEMVADKSVLYELENPNTVTLKRLDNLDTSLTLLVGFGGSAEIDSDYTVAGLSGTGVARSIAFAAGETEKEISITPIQDAVLESETLTVSLYPNPNVHADSVDSIALTLEDAPVVSIETVAAVAERSASVPGVFKVTRGNSSEALELGLNITGSARNGTDYELIAPVVSFAAGEAVQLIEIYPLTPIDFDGLAQTVEVSIVGNTELFSVENAMASLDIVESTNDGVTSTFGGWADDNEVDPDLPDANDDLNGALGTASNLVEYVNGTHPYDETDDIVGSNVFAQYETDDGYYEIYYAPIAGLTDVQLSIDEVSIEVVFDNGIPSIVINNTPINDRFSVKLLPVVDGRSPRIYRSLVPRSLMGDELNIAINASLVTE